MVHLPLVAVTKSFQWGRFSLADRNRFEKLVGFPGNPVRYRNRLFLDRPLGPSNAWHVFVDDEAIWNLSAGQWSQNRAQVGGGARLSRRLFLDVYYLRRNVSGRWSGNECGWKYSEGRAYAKMIEHRRNSRRRPHREEEEGTTKASGSGDFCG